MMRLFLDTSVLGAEFDTESKERVETTRRLFELLRMGRARACISAVTLDEIAHAPRDIRAWIEETLASFDLDFLEESEETEQLATAYLDEGALPARSHNDARHLAVATIHGVDALVSWNFKHMVNIFRRRRVHAINLRRSKPLIDIVSPPEALAALEESSG